MNRQRQLELEFKDRYIAHLNKGDEQTDICYYAIPISKEEMKEIRQVKSENSDTTWRNVIAKEMLLLGDPNKAPNYIERMMHSEEVGLPIQTARLINQTPRIYVKAFYYPPLKACRDEVHNLIPFEDYRVAWNYYKNALTSREYFNDVLIIMFKN